MATKAQYNYQNGYGGRRACTEMPDNGSDAFDLNQLPDKQEDLGVAEDVDDINFANYKGIYANDEAGQKYQCPETGAHFEFKDVCRRLNRVLEKRKVIDEQIYGKNQMAQETSKGGSYDVQAVVANEIFSSSIISEKLPDHHQAQQTLPGNQKIHVNIN